jgi:hypothetical protein
MQRGETALTFACEAGHLEVALLLLDRGAKVDATGQVGRVLRLASSSPRRRPQCNNHASLWRCSLASTTSCPRHSDGCGMHASCPLREDVVRHNILPEIA